VRALGSCTRSADGWSQWIGAAKFAEDGPVGVSITTVTNLVRDGCRDHSPADPPVGPSVDDLATALADLARFRVISPPTDITIHGYRGKHLELTVPDPTIEGRGDDRRFTECVGGELKSWIAPTLSVRGGTRSMATRALASPRSSGSLTSKGAV
jgi:hypothetical protein